MSEILKGAAKRVAKGVGYILAFTALSRAIEGYQNRRTVQLPKAMILELDLDARKISEATEAPLQRLVKGGEKQYDLLALLQALDRAGVDKRVQALAVQFGRGALETRGVATVEEIADAVAAFRVRAGERGVETVAVAESYGALGNGTLPFAIASQCSQVWLMPHGRVSLPGFATQTVFLRAFLDKYGLLPQYTRRRQFKNAVNFITEKEFTTPHYRATAALMRDFSDVILQRIRRDRGFPRDFDRRVVGYGPISASEALELGLVDRIVHPVAVPADLRQVARQALARDAIARTREARHMAGAAGAAQAGEDWLSAATAAADRVPLARVSMTRYIAALRAREALEEREEERAAAWRSLRSALTGDRDADDRAGAVSSPASVPTSPSEPNALQFASDRDWFDPMRPVRRTWWQWLTFSDPVVPRTRFRILAGPPSSPHPSSSSTPATPPSGISAAPAPAPVVALVSALGGIQDGRRKPGGLGSASGADGVYGDDLCDELARLRENAAVRVVVLRVNSPGGSADASERIAREVEALQAAGKEVIVSMGDLAASGGYYIAALADRIFAMPSTLTGSIGVVAGKISAGQLLRDWSVNVQDVARRDDKALAFSALSPMTPAQLQALNRLVDDMYDQFKAIVSAGRGMGWGRVERVARGRVWLGARALPLGLVDEHGGLLAAVEEGRRRAVEAERRDGREVDPGQVALRRFPRPKQPLAQLLARVAGGDEEAEGRPATDLLSALLVLAGVSSAIAVAPGEAFGLLGFVERALRPWRAQGVGSTAGVEVPATASPCAEGGLRASLLPVRTAWIATGGSEAIWEAVTRPGVQAFAFEAQSVADAAGRGG